MQGDGTWDGGSPDGGRASGDLPYVGWLLADDDRRRLLERFPPRFPDVIADHVTLCRADSPQAALLAGGSGRIVGHALDPAGVEALVVAIGGATRRPDGGTYHLTWSVDAGAGRKAFHSNAVIAERGWTAMTPPVDIRLHPGAWPASRYP